MAFNTKKIKVLQAIAFAVLILLTGIQYEHDAQALEIPPADWEITSHSGLTQYSTNGFYIDNHELSFIKTEHSCDADILYLSLTSYQEDIHRFEDEIITIKITLGEHSELIYVPVLNIADSGVGPQLITLTNFHLNALFLEDLSNNESVLVEILEPSIFAELLTSDKELFRIDGLSQTRQKAQNLCRSGSIS